MQIQSKIIQIKNTGKFSTQEIENQLKAQKIEPLRWSIVKIDSQNVHINVAFRS